MSLHRARLRRQYRLALRDHTRADRERRILLEHADRCWQAETENALRIERRIQLLGAGIVALLGLGIFRIDWFFDPQHQLLVRSWWSGASIQVLMIAGVMFFGAAMALLIPGRWRFQWPASDGLMMLEEDANAYALELVLNKTWSAYYDLRERNSLQWRRLRLSFVCFGGGVGAVFLATVLFLLASFPDRLYQVEDPKGADHEARAPHQIQTGSQNDAGQPVDP